MHKSKIQGRSAGLRIGNRRRPLSFPSAYANTKLDQDSPLLPSHSISSSSLPNNNRRGRTNKNNPHREQHKHTTTNLYNYSPRSMEARTRGKVIEEQNMFRSSPMSLIQLYIPVEAAQVVTLRAGDLGLIQFRDVNTCLILVKLILFVVESRG